MEVGAKNREPAIILKNVKKHYKLGQIGGGTLQADLESWWAKRRGKEDPNVKIGHEQKERLVGQSFMALNGIDLTIYQGEAVGIIGKNGAGKSTLLKLLSRVTAPTEGEIEIFGRIASMLEVGTGFNGEMTGRENVYMNGAILGMTKSEIDAKMEDIIEFSEVREFIDTPVKRYSSGMYVKLAFSVAAHLDSEIMIMDEVLAVGDMAFQKKCLDKMRDVAKREGRTVLYVSHNMNTIRRLCDKCIVLDNGQKIFEGDVEKAIAIYLATEVTAEKTKIDLSKKRMEHLSKEIKAKILEIEFINKEKAVFDLNEQINMKLRLSAKESIKHLCFRMEVRSLDGSSVGASMIHDFGDIGKNESKDYFLTTRFTGMVPDEYITCIVLYEIDEWGTYYDLDAIFPAFAFEVQDRSGEMNIKWDNSHWGKIKFEEMTIN